MGDVAVLGHRFFVKGVDPHLLVVVVIVFVVVVVDAMGLQPCRAHRWIGGRLLAPG